MRAVVVGQKAERHEQAQIHSQELWIAAPHDLLRQAR